tara:strand:+ start:247237 stop:247503 length:267 start_codon:yes stop_codon:yes gene_type:complete
VATVLYVEYDREWALHIPQGASQRRPHESGKIFGSRMANKDIDRLVTKLETKLRESGLKGTHRPLRSIKKLRKALKSEPSEPSRDGVG